MASILVRVSANSLLLSTRLLARAASSILAFTWTVTHFLAEMRTAPQFLATNLTAACILQPALDILQILLATHATLLYQKGTFRAGFVVEMATMLDLRMSACFGSVALIATWWWLRTTWERWLEYGTTAVAAQLIKDGFPTCSTRTLVAKFFADMISAF